MSILFENFDFDHSFQGHNHIYEHPRSKNERGFRISSRRQVSSERDFDL